MLQSVGELHMVWEFGCISRELNHPMLWEAEVQKSSWQLLDEHGFIISVHCSSVAGNRILSIVLTLARINIQMD